MIGIKDDGPLTYRKAAYSSSGSGLIRLIDFSAKLKRSNIIKMALGVPDVIPLKGLMISPYFFRDYKDQEGIANYSSFVSHHYIMNITSLPPPYETSCFDYEMIGYRDEIECMETCTRGRSVKAFNKIPYMTSITEPSDMQLLYFTDRNDSIIDKQFQDIQKECEFSLCSGKGCNDNQIVTITTAMYSKNLSWTHVTPIQPSFEIKSCAALPFLELIIYCFGSISTWTGLSIIKMNPFLLIGRKKKKVERRLQKSVRHFKR
jgi:hypothetical protein